MTTLHSAIALQGPRRGQDLSDRDTIETLAAPDLAWLHLQADDPETRPWIERNLDYLEPWILDALLAEETRPRVTASGEGVMLILRGVNTNPGDDPEDMVSIRLWIDSARIISLSRRRLATVDELHRRIAAGRGPSSAGGFLCALVEGLNARIEGFLAELDGKVDYLEVDVLDEPDQELRQGITDTRQDVILFRRFVAPQRDALGQLPDAEIPFLEEGHLRRLSEAHDRLQRAVEELDAMRDRLTVVTDELGNLLSDRVNRNLYVLSVISVIFLPLGFLTGLLGINVGGMPGADSPAAFWIVCALCVLIAALQLAILRRLRWI